MTKLIVGLGNPGRRYLMTRHNVGFCVVEKLASEYGADFKAHARVPAMIAESRVQGERWLILKPITYMNLSGQAVVAALNFWKLDLASILIVSDDVELVPPNIRLRAHGSAGGHNGLKSVIEHLGTKEFTRLRVGIGRPANASTEDLAEWILQPFEKTELLWLEEVVKKAVRMTECWALEGPAEAMNQYNTREKSPEKINS